jgi:hypothetical protein
VHDSKSTRIRQVSLRKGRVVQLSSSSAASVPASSSLGQRGLAKEGNHEVSR